MKNLFQKISSEKYDIQFLCTNEIDEIWIRSTLFLCKKKGLNVVLTICGDFQNKIKATYIKNQINILYGINYDLKIFSKINASLVITSSSGIGREIFPTKSNHLIHMPHSLASLHMIYPEDAFDGFDILFAAGPHHEIEFESIMKSKNFAKKSYGTGYGKLDILKENFALQDLKKEKNILIAPSWGPDNLIKKMGIQLAKKLSNLVDNVFIRPHPLLFIEDNYIISNLNELKKNYPNIKVESPWSGDNAIYKSEVLITDYSGIALEYAAIKRNKILFVDVGLKESNPNWRSYDIEPIEISIRNKLGIIVKPDLDEIIEKVIELINKKESIDIKIINSYLFSYERNCAQNTYNIIKNII